METNRNFLIIVVQLHVWTSSSPKYMLRIKYRQLFPIQTNYVLTNRPDGTYLVELWSQFRKLLSFFLFLGENSAWALPIPPLSCVTLKTADWGLSCIRIGLSLSPCPWIPFAIFLLFQYRARYTETVSERHTRENTESVRALQHVEAGLYCVYFFISLIPFVIYLEKESTRSL